MTTKEAMSEIDKILDEDCNDNVVLYDENNKETEFEQVAVIPKNEKIYVILKPVTQIEGLADDLALVFVIDEIEDEDCLVVVDDYDLVEEIFDEYYKLLEEYNEEG